MQYSSTPPESPTMNQLVVIFPFVRVCCRYRLVAMCRMMKGCSTPRVSPFSSVSTFINSHSNRVHSPLSVQTWSCFPTQERYFFVAQWINEILHLLGSTVPPAPIRTHQSLQSRGIHGHQVTSPPPYLQLRSCECSDPPVALLLKIIRSSCRTRLSGRGSSAMGLPCASSIVQKSGFLSKRSWQQELPESVVLGNNLNLEVRSAYETTLMSRTTSPLTMGFAPPFSFFLMMKTARGRWLSFLEEKAYSSLYPMRQVWEAWCLRKTKSSLQSCVERWSTWVTRLSTREEHLTICQRWSCETHPSLPQTSCLMAFLSRGCLSQDFLVLRRSWSGLLLRQSRWSWCLMQTRASLDSTYFYSIINNYFAKVLRQFLNMEQKTLTRQVMTNRKNALEQLVKRRFLYQPAFVLYGGVAGLYDYGPVGCTIKTNIEQYWREHFIIEEDMLEVTTTCITPQTVLKASGHVDKFSDLLVLDSKTKEPYRADKVVTEVLEGRVADKKTAEGDKQLYKEVLVNVDGYNQAQMTEIIKKYAIKAPETGNELTDPVPFNLMCPTSIGPSTKVEAFLRPETAQGIFLNFPRLLEQNGYKLPFGAAQIGLGFRNEIAPRNQLIRCREFQMAEIEYFVDPLDKRNEKFKEYRGMVLPLLSREIQAKNSDEAQMVQVGEAVDRGVIDNETLAYFMCRTYEFLREIGVSLSNVRFRQHMADEMAHYSSDCWDAEIEMSSGWVECVGMADRSAYDLNAHSKATGQKLQAARKFKTAQQREQINIKLDKAKIGKELKKDGTLLYKHVEALSDEDKLALMAEFETAQQKEFVIEGKSLVLKKEQVQFDKKTVNVLEEKFTPSVIEPSFGIGRILQALIEHSFCQREDPQKCYFKFPPRIAPVKCSILPVVNSEEFAQVIRQISSSLKKMGISCKTDSSGVTIGKKYARTDEIGIPFAITIDKDTIVDQTVTFREVQTTKQIRLQVRYQQQLYFTQIKDAIQLVFELSNNLTTWESALEKYPLFNFKEEEEQQQ